MKFVNVSTALRTALSWLRGRLKPPEQPTDWVEYSKQTAWRSTPRLLPPAQPTPVGGGSTLHMPTGVWRKTYLARMANPDPTQKLPTVRLSKLHFYKMPSIEEVRADKFLLDVEPAAREQESALDQLSQLTVTKHDLQAVRERHQKHESRQAS